MGKTIREARDLGVKVREAQRASRGFVELDDGGDVPRCQGKVLDEGAVERVNVGGGPQPLIAKDRVIKLERRAPPIRGCTQRSG